MSISRYLVLASALSFALAAHAQSPTSPATQDSSTQQSPGTSSEETTAAGRMAMMDAHMEAMREMHEKMSRARTPEEREALMVEQRALMQQGMDMMGGMSMGPGMGPGRGMGPGAGQGPGHGHGHMQGMGPKGNRGDPMDLATRQQMMEKRMDMMHTMMQSMMDRMAAPAASR